MKNKKIIIIAIVLIVIIGVVVLFNNKNDGGNKKIVTVNNKKTTSNGVNKNTNKNVLKDNKINNLDLTDISINYVKGTGSTFSAKITNKTKETINVESFDAIFKDKNGKEITTITLFVGGDVLPEQVNDIKSTVPEDISIAASVEYKIN